jgi:hypothetical protein
MLLPLALLAAQAAPEPLGPARAGNLRCIEPDAVHKNCRSIIRYTVHDDGSFDATVTGFIGNDGAVIIVYETSGTIEGDAVCATIRPYDVLHGRLYRDGKLLSERDAAPVQDSIRLQLQDMAGKKRCYVDQTVGGQLVSNVTLNGVVQPEPQHIAWISPEDGYALSL